MCGIIGVVADRDAVPILMEGLRRMEYRGYDSAGVAVLDRQRLQRIRSVGKVKMLQDSLNAAPISGTVGIAHTRWATHGIPTAENAHPHMSRDRIAIVHNGIIENHEVLRAELKDLGYDFTSETDSEVVAHRIHHHLASTSSLFDAVRKTVAELQGAFALAVISESDPDCVVMAREGCPAVIGLGENENFAASDVSALLPVTRRFMFLEEGDVAEIRRRSVIVRDAAGSEVSREVFKSDLQPGSVERGSYRHFMLKEIHEQPLAISQTLEERIAGSRLLEAAFGPKASTIFKQVKSVHIAACGTSYHAGLIAAHFIEHICRIPARVEIASEYRYRNPVIGADTLFVTISQSGETADTLAALRNAKQAGYLATLTVCNIAESTMVRASDLVLLTRVHHAIDRARHVDRGTRQARPRGRPGTRAGVAAVATSRVGGKDFEAGCGHSADGRILCRQAACAVSRARTVAGNRARRGAQTQGDLLHSCRRLCCRGAQARPAGTGRRTHAGNCRRPQQRTVGEAQVQSA
jgi:glucosamine--fructose-6-phosphate aminotransferase (isomerizing)